MSYCQKCVDQIAPLIGSAVKQATEGAFYYSIEPLYKIVSESECEFWAHKNLNAVGAVLKLELGRMEEHKRAYHEMFGRGDLDRRIAKTNVCKHQHMDLLRDRCIDCGETREFQLWALGEAEKQ